MQFVNQSGCSDGDVSQSERRKKTLTNESEGQLEGTERDINLKYRHYKLLNLYKIRI